MDLLASTILVAALSAAEPLPKEDVQCFAENLYHETRGEGIDGMILVGHVVLNRAETRNKSICSVVYAPDQFSWTGVQNVSVNIEGDPIETAAWETAVTLSIEMLQGGHQDMNTGADHYLNLETVSRVPNWAKQFQVVGTWGSHTFYDSRSQS